jgi:hypothetical protein
MAAFLVAYSTISVLGQGQCAGVPFDDPPAWAREAVRYQIFVERFRNGDPSNDPRPEYMQGTYPGCVPAGWKVAPWNQSWYEQQDWAQADGSGFYKTVQARRFGGDLQGVLDKLDYVLADDRDMTLAYRRTMADRETIVAFNRSGRYQIIRLSRNVDKKLKLVAKSRPGGLKKWKQTDREISFELAPVSGAALGTFQ